MSGNVTAECPASDVSDLPGGVPPFTFGTRLGLVFIVQAASLSLIAVFLCLGQIAYAATTLRRNARRHWDISTPLHWYFLSMLLAEIILATGSMMDVKWVAKAGVIEGPYCIAQGFFKNMGNLGLALSTLAIAVHTFRAIVFRWHPQNPHFTAFSVLISIWVVVVLIMTISAGTHKGDLKDYWGNTTYWCMITTRYKVQQIALQYLFMWITAFSSILLYIPLALVIKGYIVVEGRSFKFIRKNDRMDVRNLISDQTRNRGVDSKAMQMLFYPLVYTIIVLPIAAARFRAWYNHPVPVGATVFADVLYSSSGLFNVLLYTRTRPLLLPHREPGSNKQNPIIISVRSHTTTDQELTRPRVPRTSTSSLDGDHVMLEDDWSGKD